jgi:hypothetical protein
MHQTQDVVVGQEAHRDIYKSGTFEKSAIILGISDQPPLCGPV